MLFIKEPWKKQKEGFIKNPATGSFLEIDIWIPELNICFEFQDPYHYVSTWDSHRSLAQIKETDHLKRNIILSHGETYVLVPCWWDGRNESLAASIRFLRPDLLRGNVLGITIPLNPRTPFSSYAIPDVGELMLASFPLTSQFSKSISPSNKWWVGEKYDGIRFCWHSNQNKVYLRSGAELEVPISFERQFPDLILDGEIWFGRGFFAESRKFWDNYNVDELDWSLLRFVTFDEMNFKDYEFEDRYKRLVNNISTDHPFLKIAPRVSCEHKKHLSKMTEGIIKDGGEGVILRKPESVYESGRSLNLVKLKAHRGDKEGLVIQSDLINDLCDIQLPEGPVITTKLQNAKFGLAPQRGDVVTFSYENYSSKSAPTHTMIQRIRRDVTWEDVLAQCQPVPQALSLNEHTRKVFGMAPKPLRYWTSKLGEKIRNFFLKVARDKQFDPLVAENWYSVSGAYIKSLKHGHAALSYFRGSIVQALLTLFPNIGLDESKFATIPKQYWEKFSNRKLFLNKFAKENNFDPSIPENWYNVMPAHLVSRKGGSSFLNLYNNSVRSAVTQIYSDLNFDISKFGKSPGDIILDAKLRKKMNRYAAEKGFDPLIPENWYSTPRDLDLAAKSKVLLHFKGSLAKALLHLYPEISLDPTKFEPVTDDFMLQMKQLRSTLDEFASQAGFDPIEPKNWYAVTLDDVSRFPKVKDHLKMFNSHAEAIIQAYPSIGLLNYKFYKSRDYYAHLENRKQFFDKFAAEKGFDPLIAENWYHVQTDEILEQKDGYAVLALHSMSLTNALLEVYPSISEDLTKYNIRLPDSYWHSSDNRRKFFDEYASSSGFDPLVADNWYSVQKSMIAAHRHGASILQPYKGSFIRPLLDAYPSIGLEPVRFSKPPKNYWADIDNRKKFFDEFARSNEFDARIPENWYKYSAHDIKNIKGGHGVLWHSNNFIESLQEVYPNLGLIPSKFTRTQRQYWGDAENIRKYFEGYAQEHKFDPLIPTNWYANKRISNLKTSKEGRAIILRSSSIQGAIMDAFPDIGLDYRQFGHKYLPT